MGIVESVTRLRMNEGLWLRAVALVATAGCWLPVGAGCARSSESTAGDGGQRDGTTVDAVAPEGSALDSATPEGSAMDSATGVTDASTFEVAAHGSAPPIANAPGGPAIIT